MDVVHWSVQRERAVRSRQMMKIVVVVGWRHVPSREDGMCCILKRLLMRMLGDCI